MLQQRFDGFPIDALAARFAGGFEMEAEEAVNVGDMAVFVVVAKADSATVKTTAAGELVRTNLLSVQAARQVRGETRDELLDMLGLDVQLQFPVVPSARDASPDASRSPAARVDSGSTDVEPDDVIRADIRPDIGPSDVRRVGVTGGSAVEHDDVLRRFLAEGA